MPQTEKHSHEWAAGFFEGEGWCNVSKRQLKKSTRYQTYCGITNTELVLLEIFQRAYGGKIRPCKGTALSRKPLWRWECYDKTAEEFLTAISPFLYGKKLVVVGHALAIRKLINPRRKHDAHGKMTALTIEEQGARDALIVDMRKYSKGAKNV